MSDTLDDFSFLTELIRLTDADPAGKVNAEDVAASLQCGNADTEPNVRRLKSRGLIDWAPGPRRGGEGWTNTPLAVLPEGYRHDGTGMTR